MERSVTPTGPARLGLVTALGTGLTVLVACGIFQLMIPVHSDIPAASLGPENQNLRAIILYAAAGGCHTLSCTFGSLLLMVRLKAEEPPFEFLKTIMGIATSFVVIISCLFIACYFDLAVVEQSYFETMRPLLDDGRFGFMLGEERIPLSQVHLQPFALLPLTFVILGVFFSIVACFWVSHRAIDFVHKAQDLQKREITELKSEVAQLISLLSIVFTTSCISTIAFLQLARDWIEKGPVRDAYIQNGYAMSIFWSACFTMIMLGILLIPLFWVGRHTLRLRRQAKFSGRGLGFYDPFYEVFSYSFLSKVGAATLMPILTSSIAAVIGS